MSEMMLIGPTPDMWTPSCAWRLQCHKHIDFNLISSLFFFFSSPIFIPPPSLSLPFPHCHYHLVPGATSKVVRLFPPQWRPPPPAEWGNSHSFPPRAALWNKVRPSIGFEWSTEACECRRGAICSPPCMTLSIADRCSEIQTFFFFFFSYFGSCYRLTLVNMNEPSNAEVISCSNTLSVDTYLWQPHFKTSQLSL